MRVVIVGGGSAGLFCALGLAGRAQVTVVEAGIDPGTPVPDRFLDDHLYPDCDWDYVEADRGDHLVRGKVLGGSSTVNASAAVRGQPASYDTWGVGWRWEDVLPALRAVETDAQFGTDPWHGDRGPVVVTRVRQGPLDLGFAGAAEQLGHSACADHNAPGSLGVGPWPTNRVAGGRWGTLAAVAPHLRASVEIRPCTCVRALVIDASRAVGVEVDGPRGVERIGADLVVLAAGAFGTPEVLWRSGIRNSGIGAGLQDHPWVMMDLIADASAIAERPVSGGLLRTALGGDPAQEAQVFPFSAALYEPGIDPRTYRMSVAVMSPRSIGRMTPSGSGRSVRVPADPWWRGADLAQQLRARVTTYNHPVGTCGIGRVVDARLCVDGFEGLRIADASVMPSIPDANTNLASMMVGWRAAEMIVADEHL